MTVLQEVFDHYLNIKFNRGLPAVQMKDFEYVLLEDTSAELFFIDHEQGTFLEWTEAFQPQNPHYVQKPDWQPMLTSCFKQLDVYDEQVCYYLLYTINATTRIIPRNPYNKMNDFMKNYCFFQLAQLEHVTILSKEQKQQLKDFLFFFYLYSHPVNEETLYAFSFKEGTLIHAKTNINMEQYFSHYHDYICQHKHDRTLLTPHEINACKKLTIELLRSIEGKSKRLVMPFEDGIEYLHLINNVDDFLHMFNQNNKAFYQLLHSFLFDHQSNPYREHCFSMLLQNYVTYILTFHFDDLIQLIAYFHDLPSIGRMIINKIFVDTIFMQKILKEANIDINNYPTIIEFFDEDARSIYLDAQ